MPENIRREALNALAAVAIAEPGFVVDAFADPEATLATYGFDLNEQEMEVFRDFQSRVRDSDQEIDALLRDPVVLHRFWHRG
jgi:hypothetical protein